MNNIDSNPEFQPAITRVQIGNITIYEISEDELELISRGSNESIFLNFGICLISISLSFFVSLLTTTIESARIYDTFVLIVMVFLIIGILCIILWKKSRRSNSDTINKIKNRKPPEGIFHKL